jgi:hypothetical protein
MGVKTRGGMESSCLTINQTPPNLIRSALVLMIPTVETQTEVAKAADPPSNKTISALLSKG